MERVLHVSSTASLRPPASVLLYCGRNLSTSRLSLRLQIFHLRRARRSNATTELEGSLQPANRLGKGTRTEGMFCAALGLKFTFCFQASKDRPHFYAIVRG